LCADPAHTLLAVSDAQGTSQGHLWYDPHGSVLSSTLPVTLTQRLLSSQGLDSRLGLVYHGDGRYYDPAIAHTLQPDPFGGVPQLPQTLNRYAVTPVGSVVGRTRGSSYGFWTNMALAAVGEMPGAIASDLGRVTVQPIIRGTKTALSRAQRNPAVRAVLGDEVARNIRAIGRRSLAELGVQRGHVFEFTGEARLVRPGEVDDLLQGSFNKSTLGWAQEYHGWRGFLAQHDLLSGVGIDIAVEILFQLNEPYWSNPYLSSGQKVGQLTVNLTFAGLAAGATYYTVIFIGVTGPAGFVVTIVVGTAWSLVGSRLAHAFIEDSGLSQEHRRLRPLGGTP